MPTSTELQRSDLKFIAERCAEETRKFYATGESQSEYCLELFRRALVLHNDFAWECIYRQYAPTIRAWLRMDQAFQLSGESEEYFVNRTLERFWQAVQGEKFERFPDLASLLRYMRLCVKTSLIDYARTKRFETLHLDEAKSSALISNISPEKNLSQELEKEQFWLVVRGQLKSEKEQIIVYNSFLLDLKPGQIYARHGHVFSDTNEVYKIKRNVLKRLERSASVKQLLAGP